LHKKRRSLGRSPAAPARSARTREGGRLGAAAASCRSPPATLCARFARSREEEGRRPHRIMWCTCALLTLGEKRTP
jgi:hypothetical protein